MLPAWLAIGGVMIAVAVVLNRVPRYDIRWFFRLRRPRWLTFEWAIPFIWSTIFICGAISAHLVWMAEPGTIRGWLRMGFYLLLEIVIMAYTPVMCRMRSLKVGTAIGAIGFGLGAILGVWILPVSGWAVVWLMPYLLWSPIGTFVTWQMIPLNPGAE